MKIEKIRGIALQASKAIAILLGVGILFPVLIGYFLRIPFHKVLEFISSILILQAAAAIVGLGLGIEPFPIVILMTCVALALILAIFDICDTFAISSERVRSWIDRMDSIARNNSTFDRYGELVLVAIIWIPGIGLYGCAIISWILQWRSPRAIALMLAGWIIATFVVIFASTGMIHLAINILNP